MKYYLKVKKQEWYRGKKGNGEVVGKEHAQLYDLAEAKVIMAKFPYRYELIPERLLQTENKINIEFP